MLRNQYSKVLEQLRKNVEQLQEDVPAEAASFQRESTALLDNIAGLPWVVWPKDIQALKERAEKLQAIGPRLKDLIHRSQKVAEEVSRVRALADGPQERAFLVRKCDEWMHNINELGRDVDQERHLQLDDLKIRELESTVGEYIKALELLAQAEKYCRELPKIEVAVLESKLPQWKEVFQRSGPSEQALAELESLLDPLRNLRPAPTEPPPRVVSPVTGQLRRLFDELRAWSRALSRAIDPSLEDSYRRLNQGEITESEMESVRGRLSAAVESLRAEAAGERVADLRQIRQDAGHFHKASNENTELDQKIAELGNIPADTPQNYESWKRRYKEVNEFFFNIAKTREDELSKYLKARSATLEARRLELAARLLSRKARNEIVALGAQITELSAAADETSLRKELRDSDDVEEKLSMLEKEALEAEATYQNRKSTLIRDLEEVHEAAMAYEHREMTTASARLLEQAQQPDPGGGDLDDLTVRLDALAEQCVRLRNNLLTHCSSVLAELFDYCRSAHLAVNLATEALGREGRERRFASEQPRPATPAQAVQQLKAWGKMREQYLARMNALVDEVIAAVPSQLEALQRLASQDGYLSPEQRDQADALISNLNHNSIPATQQDVLARFGYLADMLDRSRMFVRSVEGEREEVRRLYERLRNRLREFSEDELKNVFPEIAERISALVYGVDPECPFAEARKQLEFAATALSVLERQAVRLAAEDLARTYDEVAQVLREGKNQALKAAFDEVGEYAPEQLAPASVRRRLSQYLRTGGARERG